MRQHDTGNSPLVPQGRHGRTRTVSTVLAAAGAAGLLGAGALLGLTPGAQETTAAPPTTTTASSTPTHPGTPTPTAPQKNPATATPIPTPNAPSENPAPPQSNALPPAPVIPASGVMPAASAPVRLTVQAAGIDQPVIPLTPTAQNLAEQSIVPPLTTDAYWLSTYGHPGAGSQNTTYITGHSWEGLDAPFDRLSTQVAPGDTVMIGTGTGEITYVVDSVTTYDKNTLKDSEIWNIVPNRLVLISCFTQDPWGKNVVVTATPTP